MKFFLLFLMLCSFPLSAVAGNRPTIAVLEYRAGVSELPDLAERLVELLRTKSNSDVLSPQDCRRMLGASLDALVSECKEDIPCFARLGKKLGASEILLIGMTEFGTVLININRILVDKQKTAGTVDLDIKLGGQLTKLQIYQLLRKIYPEESFRRFGTLDITSNQKGATVKLDSRTVGQTPIEPLKLEAPRKYSIQLQKPGFIPFQATVDLVPNARLRLDAQLSPVGAGSGGAWYKKWWVISLAAGVVLAAGGTLWYLNQPPSQVPATVILP